MMLSNSRRVGNEDIGTYSSVEDTYIDAIEVYERSSEFMHFFFRHLTYCPPHGPFRHYCALTFVERAKRKFGTNDGESQANPGNKTNSGSYGSEDGGKNGNDENSMTIEDEEQRQRHELYQMITIPCVLALIEKYYDCKHLGNWPLLYIHADVHLDDVKRKLNEWNSTTTTKN